MSVRLERLSVATLSALAAGDVATARHLVGLAIPAEFAEAVDIWRYMITLVETDPLNADWLMQAVVADGVIVGNAGFKGTPSDGGVELGYRILSTYRRRGMASAAVSLLLSQASTHANINYVLARISPDNSVSIAVVTKAGFSQIDDHQHPRWGRQLQFSHGLRKLKA